MHYRHRHGGAVSGGQSECGMAIVPDFAFVVDEETQGARIGVPKGETELLEVINQVVDQVVEGRHLHGMV